MLSAEAPGKPANKHANKQNPSEATKQEKPSSRGLHPSSSSSFFHLSPGEPVCARLPCVRLLPLQRRVRSIRGGSEGFGRRRLEDAAGASATGTVGAGSEQHVPGHVTLCRPQWRVLGRGAG